MTVATNTNKAQHLGNGVTKTFPYSFRIYGASDLVVTVTDLATGVDTPQVLNTNYTVTGADSYNGGNVVFVSAPASNTRVTIRRVLPFTQLTDLRNQGAYLAETHEDVFDRLMMIAQQQHESVGRSLQLREGTSGVSAAVPAPSAGRALKWSADGMALVNSDVDPDSQVAAAAAQVVLATAQAETATAAAATATTKAGEASTSAANAATSAGNASTSAAEAAASAASINPNTLNGPRVMGLVGNVNGATPLTKYDLSALMVTLRNAAGATVTRYATGTLTCDIGLAGAAANGRDQAGAFTANSWVYLYFIWNGTTLATIASTSSTAPTLPTGYTHYALATALRWNASSNIVPCYARGRRVAYDGAPRVATNVYSATFAAISCATAVPPNALGCTLSTTMLIVHNALGVEFSGSFRPTGSTHATGKTCNELWTQVINNTVSSFNTFEFELGTSQQIDYRITPAPFSSGGLYIDVTGYIVPNGDA